MSREQRHWDGNRVHVATTDPLRDGRSVDAAMTPETAGALANLLRKQTGLSSILEPLPEGLQELMAALDYVLVSDPASVHAHQAMERGRHLPRPRPFRASEVRDGE